jgi:tryptophan synthase alpha chain
MTRLEQLFTVKQKNVLNVYCTAGFPEPDSTLQVMKALETSGADIIELGIPYSDPLADGPVIQMSSARALANGMNLDLLFKQLQNFRNGIHIPVVLMGYMNTILKYGFEKFCSDAKETGIDGLIIPDLPMIEFEKEYQTIIRKYRLNFTFLVTPETSEDRVKKLDELSSGFLYAVSASSVTGGEKDLANMETYLKRLQGYHLHNPVLVGFGIKDKPGFQAACRYANGAIIGSAYINAISNTPDILTTTTSFINDIVR